MVTAETQNGASSRDGFFTTRFLPGSTLAAVSSGLAGSMSAEYGRAAFLAVAFFTAFLATAFLAAGFFAAFSAGAFFTAAFLAATFFGAAFLAATFFTAAFFGAAFLAATFFTAAFFGAAFLAATFFTAAFFLSRSYVVILYLLVALVVGHYTRMRATYPSLPVFSLEKDLIRWPSYAVIGVIGLYLTVKVLLALA